MNAVITGDITESSKLNIKQREILLEALKKAFEHISYFSKEKIEHSEFQIYRGDSFQGIIYKPENALKASVIIRASLKKSLMIKPFSIAGKKKIKRENLKYENENLRYLSRYASDARIAIGIGNIDFLPQKDFKGTGNGEAYRRSGPTLDRIKNLKSDVRLVINTPWEEINSEMNVSFGLLDNLIEKWTSAQAEALLYLFRGLRQNEIAEELKISQASVNVRLRPAGWYAIEKLLSRYEYLIKSKLSKSSL